MIKFNFANLFADKIGKENGITKEEVLSLKDKVKEYHKMILDKRNSGELYFFHLPYEEKIAKAVSDYASEVREWVEDFILLGIGGSSLGPQALFKALKPPFWNELPPEKRKGPRMYFIDNIDPVLLKSLLDVVNLERSLINVISKSGGTVETISQFLIVKQLLEERVGKDRARKQIVVTTDPQKGNLREVAITNGYHQFFIPPAVGGRFSILTPVGLLPMSIMGEDINQFLLGAKDMDKLCSKEELEENPAYLSAVLYYLLHTKKGKNISVMMPYSSQLEYVAYWYRQLWAESLGKRYSLKGEEKFIGHTPVKAVGVTDQHSQLQLYIEGPSDKIIMFINVEEIPEKLVILNPIISQWEYLKGKHLGNLLHIEQIATQQALTKAQRPNCQITLEKISPYNLGALFFWLEVKTTLAGYLYEINPFDQPGVELGKLYTYALLGRKGYEKYLTELTPNNNSSLFYKEGDK